MARSVADVEALARVMVAYSCTSLDVAPVPWRAVTAPVLRVGLVRGYSLLEPTVSQVRALCTAAEAMERTDITTVEIDLNDMFEELVVCAVGCFLRDEETLRLMRGQIRSAACNNAVL
jgi:Asp-tRNA(Asn)/Glu-tRNA(Gln) amidotransferase A subunit family amidase